MDLGRFQCLGQRHRRQDARQAAREHRLAAAGRADHQDVVAAGGRDLERALRVILPFHFGEIHVDRREVREDLGHVDRGTRQLGPLAEVSRHVGQRVRAAHVEAFDDRGFAHVAGGEDQPGASRLARRDGDGERAAHGANLAVEAELAEDAPAGQPVQAELLRCAEDA